MFADRFTLKIGETEVKGRRLTIKEIRSNLSAMVDGTLGVDESLKLIREHVTLSDGSTFDPEELTQNQVRELIAELVLPKEGRGIADFIGLLC